MNYIFDLDGTLVDASERMYRLFCELVPEHSLTKDAYWQYKRNKVNHKALLEQKYPTQDFGKFEKRWMSLIESDKYIQMDSLYHDTTKVLSQLKQKKDFLILLTARQSKKMLLNELADLEILKYFDLILTTENKFSKKEVLVSNSEKYPEVLEKENVFISDMGSDIRLGNELEYYTIAITHGFMSCERLKEYNPKKIINELSELL